MKVAFSVVQSTRPCPIGAVRRNAASDSKWALAVYLFMTSVPGSFESESMRLSFATSMENLGTALDRLAEATGTE